MSAIFFFVFPTLAEEQLNELSPAPTTLRALRELFDFDVRKSSAAFVTRSVRPSRDCSAVIRCRCYSIRRYSCPRARGELRRGGRTSPFAIVSPRLFTTHKRARRAPLKFEQKLHQPHSQNLFALPLLSFLRKPLR